MADTSVKLSGTYDSIEAYNIMVEMQNMSADYEEIRTEAAAAASAATAASTAATNAVNTANTAVANAQTYAGNANTSAGEAAGYASDASTAANNAASSETNAHNSEVAAAASATSAAASEAVVAGALPLSGGTMTGAISFDATGQIGYRSETHESTPRPCKQLMLSSTDINHWADEGGAKMALHTYDSTGTNTAENGSFGLLATDGTNSADLVGYPSGALTWAGKHLECAPDLSVFKTAQQFTAPTIISNRIKDIGGGYKRVGNVVYVYIRFKMNTTLTKGGWGVAGGFPAPYNMGFSADYRIPLIATAWYGDSNSGNVSSAFIDSDGTMRLIINGQLESSNLSNYYIHVYGTYYAE